MEISESVYIDVTGEKFQNIQEPADWVFSYYLKDGKIHARINPDYPFDIADDVLYICEITRRIRNRKVFSLLEEMVNRELRTKEEFEDKRGQ